MIKKKTFIDFRKLFANNLIPYEAVIEITSDCNMRCIHCNRKISANYISINNYSNLLNELKQLGTMRIFITGGEPSIHPDFLKILQLTADNKFTFSVQTNLSNINDKIIDFFKNNVFWTSIQISLYGYNEITYVNNCKIKGIFAKIKDSLEKIKLTNKRVILKTLVTTETYDYINELKNFGKKYSDIHLFDFTVFNDDYGTDKNKKIRANIKQYSEYYNGLLEHHPISLKKKKQNKFNKNKYLNNHICSAGRTNLAITSTGDVLPCLALRLPCGNAFKNGLINIWNNSEKLNEFRKYKIKDLENCPDCDILQNCKYKCPGLFYAENNNFLKPAEFRCELNKIFLDICEKQCYYQT
jgi:radical SAM protein with 4Fe4S-binding SPASM domain